MSTPAKTTAYALGAKLIRDHLKLLKALAGHEPTGMKGPPLVPEQLHPDTVAELERMAAAMESAAVIQPLNVIVLGVKS